MEQNREVSVVYENGVFRPETQLNLPEHGRYRAVLTPISSTKSCSSAFVGKLRELRARAGVHTSGWRFDRDRLYDRD
jgi:predicted DNA-binding antitoxin AbrB/MazE fold protein